MSIVGECAAVPMLLSCKNTALEQDVPDRPGDTTLALLVNVLSCPGTSERSEEGGGSKINDRVRRYPSLRSTTSDSCGVAVAVAETDVLKDGSSTVSYVPAVVTAGPRRRHSTVDRERESKKGIEQREHRRWKAEALMVPPSRDRPEHADEKTLHRM